MTSTMNRPLPEALGRHDTEPRSGEWDVSSCEPTRGLPVTSVEQRFMRVPMGDDELSRVVRAHELIHAKVSPRDLRVWADRKIASDDAMRAVEEVRVNYLASTLGYNTKILLDGSEQMSGERAVALNDWRGAVLFATAVAGTGASKKFLNGVRRHNRVWADVLADFEKRLMKEIKKVGKDRLSSTHTTDGLLLGFSHTERLAEWVDRIAGESPTPDEDEPTTDRTDGGDSDTDADSGEEAKTPPPKKRGRPRKDESRTSGAVSKSRTKSPIGGSYRDVIPSWMKLKVERVPLPDVLGGSLGKKRIASATGKNPRRIHRMLTDPQRRVFDKTVKGKGGIVIVDCSGSMSLTREQVRDVVMASPGCSVVAYTVRDWEIDENGEAVQPNAWVLADAGRICDELPFDRGFGNGVDLPILEWAVKNRKKQSSPIVWVSDGGVTGMGDNSHTMLYVKVIEFVKRHNIAIVDSPSTAVTYLTALANGERKATELPTYLKHYGKEAGIL
jgi:hypothetical protein